jgi:hypothetical protein
MARIPGIKAIENLWTQDGGLTRMLILVCISDFLILPFLTDKFWLGVFLSLIYMALILIGIINLSKSRTQMIILSIIPLIYFTLNWAQIFTPREESGYVTFIFEVASYCLLIGLLLVKVFERGSVTIHHIIGSVVVYMIIANLWSEMYYFINLHYPGAISTPSSSLTDNQSHASFLYFSFTTLTTTGYGEFVPAHPFVRSLVMIEQLIGVMYPVILIGRLVSLKVEDMPKKAK